MVDPRPGRPGTAPRVLAGVDAGSADAAADFAAAEAEARGAELGLLGTYETFPSDAWSDEQCYELQDELRADVATVLARTVERIHARRPRLAVVTETLEFPAAQALITRSADAVLVVVGSHRYGTAHRLFLGSVSAEVAARGRCPVIVVPPPLPGSPFDAAGVVVGVEPTPGSKAVLRFAFEYASRHGEPLRAVLCTRPVPATSPHGRRAARLGRRARPWLADALAGWQDAFPDVQVTSDVTMAHPAAALVDAGRHAALLVVGTHGRSAVGATMLGSVGQGVLHHAGCPVAVVPV